MCCISFLAGSINLLLTASIISLTVSVVSLLTVSIISGQYIRRAGLREWENGGICRGAYNGDFSPKIKRCSEKNDSAILAQPFRGVEQAFDLLNPTSHRILRATEAIEQAANCAWPAFPPISNHKQAIGNSWIRLD
jgi:hypothetical protein